MVLPSGVLLLRIDIYDRWSWKVTFAGGAGPQVRHEDGRLDET